MVLDNLRIDFERTIVSIFDSFALGLSPKYNNFLGEYCFLAKNLSV